MNHITLMGRLTADPELRHTGQGIPVASFTVAVNRPFKTDGKYEADFVSCAAWRQTGEFIKNHFTKGEMIALEGRLASRAYEDKGGNKRVAWEVVVDKAHFCGGKNEVKPKPPDVDNDADFEDVVPDGDELPF